MRWGRAEVSRSHMSRFIIADPSLKDIRGHHYALSTAASHSAALAGFEVWWFCSSNISDGFASDAARIRPTFGATMYDNYVLSATENSEKETLIDKIAARLQGREAKRTRQAAQAGTDQSKAFARDLLNAINDCGLNQNDRILIHTADGATYTALAQIFSEISSDSAPLFHVVTPYDPAGVMPNRRNADEVNDAVRSLVETGVIDRRVFLYGENSLLAKHLAALWRTEVRPHPLPAQEPEEDDRRRAGEFRRRLLGPDDDKLMIVSLGSARMEKGFHLFPDIVKRSEEFLQDPLWTKVRFVLHASPQIIGRHPVIAKTIGELEVLGAPLVTLFKQTLSEEDYRAILLAADAVLLPYIQKDYLYRSSGIVSEALAAAKPLIATSNSYPGSAASAAGGLIASTPREFGAAVAEFARRPERYAASAKAAQVRELEENAVKDYAPKLLRNEAARQAEIAFD